MNQIKSISYNLASTSSYDALVRKTYDSVKFLSCEYPNFEYWFYFKVLPEVNKGIRTINLRTHNGKIAGISILKKAFEEKKICTLWVAPEFRGKGLGDSLLCEAKKFLDTEHPLITVSEKRVNDFLPLFERHNFHMHSEHLSFYENGIFEYSFNSCLEREHKSNTPKVWTP